MYIECDNDKEVVEKLKKVFGIHSIVVATKVNTNTEDIKKYTLDLMKKLDFKTF